MLALRSLGSAAQFRLSGLIFQQRFEAHHNLTDPAFLAKIAICPVTVENGRKRGLFMTEEGALAWIQGTDLRSDVLAAAKLARERGIQGSPFVVIDGKYAICGAQEEEDYLAVCFWTAVVIFSLSEGP